MDATVPLSQVEAIALRHVANGLSDADTAAAMGLTTDAIRILLAEMLDRFGVQSQADLIMAAGRRGGLPSAS